MRCEKVRRRLSDEIDGALAPRERETLARHLAACPSCRAYRESLLELQAGARALNRGAERPESYWSDFGARLEARLGAEPAPSVSARAPRVSREAWAWSGAGLVAAAAVIAALLVLKPADVRSGPFVFSFEETVAGILTEIGDDAELERAFAGALQSSIVEAVGGAGEDGYDPASADPLLLESLSEEDLSRLEAGLRDEKKS